jgi:transcriptional regulator with XRE-family HTH domain
LAADLSATGPYVGLLERGLRMPSIRVAQNLARALGTTPGELPVEVEREQVE